MRDKKPQMAMLRREDGQEIAVPIDVARRMAAEKAKPEPTAVAIAHARNSAAELASFEAELAALLPTCEGADCDRLEALLKKTRANKLGFQKLHAKVVLHLAAREGENQDSALRGLTKFVELAIAPAPPAA